VDAIWIENMNTVLDDNCTLCLPNGERIKLNPTTMRALFEVQDLSVASPATVSRCGMVYMPPEELGWQPYVTTWIDVKFRTERGAGEEAAAYLHSLFNEHVDAGLNWVRRKAKESVPSVDINLVTSCTFILHALLAPERGVDFSKPTEVLHPQLLKLFVYSFMWSIGGNMNAGAWDPWDGWMRDRFPVFPSSGLVFDYFVDSSDFSFQPWSKCVPAFEYSAATPYFEMLVPTLDTVRYSFLLEVLLEVQKSVLFTGDTGVGKSVIVADSLARFTETKNIVPVTIYFSAQVRANIRGARPARPARGHRVQQRQPWRGVESEGDREGVVCAYYS